MRLERLRDERGVALALAIMMMLVLTSAATTTIYLVTSNSTSSDRSKSAQVAYFLAESGINTAAAVLNLPSNNAQVSTTLPNTEPGTGYSSGGGTYKYWGVYDSVQNRWTVYGKGIVASPNPGVPAITRTLSATIDVRPSQTQPLNAQAWNYWFATNQGGPNACDVTVSNNVEVDSSFYILGNLCLANNAKIVEDLASPRLPIIVSVLGKTQFSPGTSIGRTGTNRVTEVHLGGGCGSNLSSTHTCKAYPTSGFDQVYANTFDTAPVTITPPVVDWSYWYNNGSPGPLHPCNVGAVRPPVFDDNGVMNLTSPYANGSVPTTFDLTPTLDYSCTTSTGSISWNATTKTLTVSGAMYIDGSAAVTNQAVNEYNGQATLYLSGTFTIDGMLCGKRNAGKTDCDFPGWNPNTEMLIVGAHGQDGSSNSVILDQNAKWEGGIYALNKVWLQNNSVIEGPTIGGTYTFTNNTTAKPFPTITTVPLGAPGNPNVYAQPQPPGGFSG